VKPRRRKRRSSWPGRKPLRPKRRLQKKRKDSNKLVEMLALTLRHANHQRLPHRTHLQLPHRIPLRLRLVEGMRVELEEGMLFPELKLISKCK